MSRSHPSQPNRPSRLRRLRAEFRQRAHHRAFRIDEPSIDDRLRTQLEQVLAAVGPAASTERDGSSEPPLDLKALAEAATNLWRAQRKIDQSGDAMSSQGRQSARYLRTCRDALTDLGLVIHDHDGEPYHPGLSIEVVVIQPDPALVEETIVETVRPTISFQAERIQMGQVVVGRPDRDVHDVPGGARA
jgi:hypothetical protein